MHKGSECRMVIGRFVSIGQGVQFISGGIHPPSCVSTYPFRIKWNMNGAYENGMPETKGNIPIGLDVRCRTDVVVLSGLSIGHGAIVVTRSAVISFSTSVCCRGRFSGHNR